MNEKKALEELENQKVMGILSDDEYENKKKELLSPHNTLSPKKRSWFHKLVLYMAWIGIWVGLFTFIAWLLPSDTAEEYIRYHFEVPFLAASLFLAILNSIFSKRSLIKSLLLVGLLLWAWALNLDLPAEFADNLFGTVVPALAWLYLIPFIVYTFKGYAIWKSRDSKSDGRASVFGFILFGD